MKLSFKNRELVVFDGVAVAEEVARINAVDAAPSAGSVVTSRHVVAVDVSGNRLRSVVSCGALAHVTELNLSGNELRAMGEMPPLLKQLRAHDNALESVEGLSRCTQLTHVSLQRNRLTSAALLDLPPSVVSLNVSSNALSSLRPLLRVVKLQKLVAENNEIARVAETVCLGGLRYLRHLSLRGNPVTTNAKLIPALTSSLPKLTTLDGATLAQAQASRIYQLQQQQQRESAVRRQRELANVNSSLRRTRRELEEHHARDNVELRCLEAKVSELERLHAAETRESVELQRQNVHLRGQLQRLDSVEVMQKMDLDTLTEEKQALLELRRSLAHTEGSLNSTFGSYRAQIMSQRVGHASLRRVKTSFS